MASDEETVARRVAQIPAIDDPDDGVEFLDDAVTTAVIRDGALHSGVRRGDDDATVLVLVQGELYAVWNELFDASFDVVRMWPTLHALQDLALFSFVDHIA